MPPKKAAPAAKIVKRQMKKEEGEVETQEPIKRAKRQKAKEVEPLEKPSKSKAKKDKGSEVSVEPQQKQAKKEEESEVAVEPEKKQRKRATKKEASQVSQEAEQEPASASKPSKSKNPVENEENDKPKKKKAAATKPKKTVEENGESSTTIGKKNKPKTVSKAPKNATLTNWESIDFTCSAKNPKGKTPNFHITSWNVDGIRAWLKKGGLDILQHDKPDILCLQETKCSSDKLPDEVKNIEGYETFWCSSEKDGYAGVGIVTKVSPINVTYGIDAEEHDAEGRCITLEFDNFYLINVYVPNAGRKLVTLPKRLDWNELFKTYVKNLDSVKPVIVCGDMNVSHLEIDLANPKANKRNAGFTQEERDGMTNFLGDGYVDTFRKFYPTKEKAYTFWTYMANARAKNVGWRLDYFIVSERFMEKICDNIIHGDVLGSDHCPLSLHMFI